MDDDTASEYIDGLIRHESPSGFRTHEASATPPFVIHPSMPTASKQPGHRLTRRTACVIIGALATITFGCCAFSALPRVAASETAQQKPDTIVKTVVVTETVTVTVTKTVEVMPEQCRIALEKASKILEQAQRVASANNQQLDIMGSAYRAIFQKDYKALNKAIQEQRDFAHELSEDAVPVQLLYQDVMNGMASCLATE